MMMAKIDHEGGYGIKDGRFGRVTRGRHILKEIDEGEKVEAIRPVVLELSEKDAFVTKDLDLVLEEGMVVDTCVQVALDRRSPVSCEQFLVITGREPARHHRPHLDLLGQLRAHGRDAHS